MKLITGKEALSHYLEQNGEITFQALHKDKDGYFQPAIIIFNESEFKEIIKGKPKK